MNTDSVIATVLIGAGTFLGTFLFGWLAGKGYLRRPVYHQLALECPKHGLFPPNQYPYPICPMCGAEMKAITVRAGRRRGSA